MKKISDKRVAIAATCPVGNGSGSHGGIEEIRISQELQDFLVLNPVCGRSDYTGLPGVKQGTQSPWRTYQYYPRRSREVFPRTRQISEERQRKFAEARLQRQQRQEEKLRKKQERTAANRERKRLASLERLLKSQGDSTDDACDKEESNVIISSPQKKEWNKSSKVRKSFGLKQNSEKGSIKSRKDRAGLFSLFSASSENDSNVSPEDSSSKLGSLIDEIASVNYVPPKDLNLDNEEEEVLKELLKLDENCSIKKTASKIKQGKTSITGGVSKSCHLTPEKNDSDRLPIRATLVKSCIPSCSSNETEDGGETWSIVSSSYRHSSVKAVADSSTERRTRRRKTRVNYIEWEEFDDLNDDESDILTLADKTASEKEPAKENKSLSDGELNSDMKNKTIEKIETVQSCVQSDISSSAMELVSSSMNESNVHNNLSRDNTPVSSKDEVKTIQRTHNEDKKINKVVSQSKDSSHTMGILTSYRDACHYNISTSNPPQAVSLSPYPINNSVSGALTLTTANTTRLSTTASLPSYSCSNLISMLSQPAPIISGNSYVPLDFLQVGHQALAADYSHGGLSKESIPFSSPRDLSTCHGFNPQYTVSNPSNQPQAQGILPILSPLPPSQPPPLSVINPQSSFLTSSLSKQHMSPMPMNPMPVNPSFLQTGNDLSFSPSPLQMSLYSNNASFPIRYPSYDQHSFPTSTASGNIQLNASVGFNVQSMQPQTAQLYPAGIHVPSTIPEMDRFLNPMNSSHSGFITPRFNSTPNVTVAMSQNKSRISGDSRSVMSGQMITKTLPSKQSASASQFSSMNVSSSNKRKLVPHSSNPGTSSGMKRNLPVSGASDQPSQKVTKTSISTKEKSLKDVDEMLNSFGIVPPRKSTDKQIKTNSNARVTTSSCAKITEQCQQSKRNTLINSERSSELQARLLSSPHLRFSQPSNILQPPPAHSKTLPSSLVYSHGVTSQPFLNSVGSYHTSYDSSLSFPYPSHPQSQSQQFSLSNPAHAGLPIPQTPPLAPPFRQGSTQPPPFNPSHVRPPHTQNRVHNTNHSKQASNSSAAAKGKRPHHVVAGTSVSRTVSSSTSAPNPPALSRREYVAHHIHSQRQMINSEPVQRHQIRQQSQPAKYNHAPRTQNSSLSHASYPNINPPENGFMDTNAFDLFNLRPLVPPTTNANCRSLPSGHQNFTRPAMSKVPPPTAPSIHQPPAHSHVRVCQPNHVTIATKTTTSVTSSLSSFSHSHIQKVSQDNIRSQPETASKNAKAEASYPYMKESAPQACHQNKSTSLQSIKMEALSSSSSLQVSKQSLTTSTETLIDRKPIMSKLSNSSQLPVSAALQTQRIGHGFVSSSSSSLASQSSSNTFQAPHITQHSSSSSSSHSTSQAHQPLPSPTISSSSSQDIRDPMLIRHDRMSMDDSEEDGFDFRSDDDDETMDVKPCITKDSSFSGHNLLHTHPGRISQQNEKNDSVDHFKTSNVLRSESTTSVTFSANFMGSKSTFSSTAPTISTNTDRNNPHSQSSQLYMASLHTLSTASTVKPRQTELANVLSVIPTCTMSQQLSSILSRVKAEAAFTSKISSYSSADSGLSSALLPSTHAKSTMGQNVENSSLAWTCVSTVPATRTSNVTSQGITERSSSCLPGSLASVSQTYSSGLSGTFSFTQNSMKDVKPSLSDLNKALKMEREYSDEEEGEEFCSEEEEEMMDIKPFLGRNPPEWSNISKKDELPKNRVATSRQNCNVSRSSESQPLPIIGTVDNISLNNDTFETISTISKTCDSQSVLLDSHTSSSNQTTVSKPLSRVTDPMQTCPASLISASSLSSSLLSSPPLLSSMLSSAPSLSSQLLPACTMETTLTSVGPGHQLTVNSTSRNGTERLVSRNGTERLVLEKANGDTLACCKSNVDSNLTLMPVSPSVTDGNVAINVSSSVSAEIPVSSDTQQELNAAATPSAIIVDVTCINKELSSDSSLEGCAPVESTTLTSKTDSPGSAQLSFDTFVSPACTSCIVTVTTQTSNSLQSNTVEESKSDRTSPLSISKRYESDKEKPTSDCASVALSITNSKSSETSFGVFSVISNPFVSTPSTPSFTQSIITTCTTYPSSSIAKSVIDPTNIVQSPVFDSLDHNFSDPNTSTATSSVATCNITTPGNVSPNHQNSCSSLPPSCEMSEVLPLRLSVISPVSTLVSSSQISAASNSLVSCGPDATSEVLASENKVVSYMSSFPNSETNGRDALSIPHVSVSTVQITSDPNMATETENDTQITIGQSNLISNLIRIKTEISEEKSQSDSQCQMLDSGILLSGKEYSYSDNYIDEIGSETYENADETNETVDPSDAGAENTLTSEPPVESKDCQSLASPSKPSFLATLVESHVRLKAAQKSIENNQGDDESDCPSFSVLASSAQSIPHTLTTDRSVGTNNFCQSSSEVTPNSLTVDEEEDKACHVVTSICCDDDAPESLPLSSINDHSAGNENQFSVVITGQTPDTLPGVKDVGSKVKDGKQEIEIVKAKTDHISDPVELPKDGSVMIIEKEDDIIQPLSKDSPSSQENADTDFSLKDKGVIVIDSPPTETETLIPDITETTRSKSVQNRSEGNSKLFSNDTQSSHLSEGDTGNTLASTSFSIGNSQDRHDSVSSSSVTPQSVDFSQPSQMLNSLEDTASTISSTSSQSLGSNVAQSRCISAIGSWTKEKVSAWLKKNKLDKICLNLSNLDGPGLQRMVFECHRDHQVFYSRVKKSLGLSMFQTLVIIRCLKSLIQDDESDM